MKVLFLDVDGVMTSWRHYDRLEAEGRLARPPNTEHMYSDVEDDTESKQAGVLPITYYFDPVAVTALNLIMHTARPRIVISSSWRTWNLRHLYEHFRWQGYSGPCFYSRTPHSGVLDALLDDGPGVRRSKTWNRRHGFRPSSAGDLEFMREMCRGQEVDWWLQNVGRGKVESFAILDDVDGFNPHLDRLVQTDFEVGLTQENGQMVIDLLKE